MKAIVNGAETYIPEEPFHDWIDPADLAVSIDMHEGRLSEDPLWP